MPGYYLDGNVPVEILEFSIPSSVTDSSKAFFECPQGFVSKLKTLHITINFNGGAIGERGFWPRIISPSNNLLFEVIGGDDYYGSNTTAPVTPLLISYATSTGTPTFSFASNPANLPDVQITILPDIWTEASTKWFCFCQNFQGGDNIGTISGLVELKEDIGRAGFGQGPESQGATGADAWLLYSE